MTLIPRIVSSVLPWAAPFWIVAVFGFVWIPRAQADAPETAHIYQKYCAVCHGKTGNGQTSAGQGMTPPPTDFTAPEVLVTLSRERMIQSIREGRKGTAMVAWKELLSDAEIVAVTDHIRDTLMLSSREKGASPGRKLFATHCSVCHGDKGDVAVWARNGLSPPPRNFTTDLARRELSRERMTFSVTYGRPETAMQSWVGRLKPDEIEQVIDYIRHAFMFPGEEGQTQAGPSPSGQEKTDSPDHKQHERGHKHDEAADMSAAMPRGLAGDPVWGKLFYDRNCTDCHGAQGDGKGKRSDFVYPKPRNFLHPASRHKLNRPHLFEVISHGERGTEMPAWDKVLTNQEIAHLVEYVFKAFIQPTTEPDSHHHSGPGSVEHTH
ncbi:MAG: c-type cytochrome [Magnetococcales bacterium]|nr:c-type cytochrome [Magnetococcales bacterium]